MSLLRLSAVRRPDGPLWSSITGYNDWLEEMTVLVTTLEASGHEAVLLQK
jgi:hypothetical protein